MSMCIPSNMTNVINDEDEMFYFSAWFTAAKDDAKFDKYDGFLSTVGY